ncbi:4Fe-4S binding protein [Noviherbaspirillum sp.]|jgi:polyferredoxin|uniref:4Fe-4S binding protein n=1 Tax=Noviherbaspirillum sp. TaxID=1926288 RepID=UPI0025E4B8B2|nr:4Fe-4S binding protein [Noviherbaspirillum sp.]
MHTPYVSSGCASAARPAPARRGLVAKIGSAMQRNRRVILAIQWVVVFFYLLLLIVPAFMPIPPDDAHIYNNLRLFSQFLFWGIWWPFVMLSTMLLGRVWCGVFCPEGALTEMVSRHGLGRAIPRWMRWGGWPFVAFVCTTIYGQLVSVYEYPQAALLVLGGSTVAAVAVGFVYGKGKRVWCRYLCPANGVFALLAKIAPLHFRVDEEVWKRNTERMPMVDCAPLIDIRHMKSASACHACGRCSDYRDAVQLAVRNPASEILNTRSKDVSHGEALTLIFGVLGIATSAFQWSSSRLFVHMKTAAATWLVEHDAFALLQDNAPWWLLTHYPQANDVFTWLDGLCILAYILGGGLALGSAVLALIWLAARIANLPALPWRRLAMGLVPVAGMSVFLGLSMLTLGHLKAERVSLEWVAPVRILLLTAGSGFSALLGWRLLALRISVRRLLAFAAYLLPVALIVLVWVIAFFV